ncbi:MAG: type II toxin-antitoxin system RelE/ParE family toxin [Flavobacteriaceae bacterium CG_4_8_14_3_um_filter_34_10]|nr:MAG: type II toxin-antitoxin system RelE/ParE family toxin [Flavobacteriaceae bacterium CG02_land_8_20_14_3_00_34_13]PIX08456.1 MAG: type II toxin-antitoxin system RelE/ParE family toxin [Flavobacteriaceae bacterium CG_4_8_14_3_um_filter_34_10]PJC05969.1 MAG: type II toxin-antitoxin system RelE/ParE family toxin [Flavobacteriaceae bacterium CG_4_9_14_0_8_um_filter_34_30]
MAKVILRKEAIDDLNNIWKYTFEKWSENQADKYYEMLKLACKEIGKNPEIGKGYNKITKNLLGLHSGRHIIFYQLITQSEIEIIRVLHERMDLKNRLNK